MAKKTTVGFQSARIVKLVVRTDAPTVVRLMAFHAERNRILFVLITKHGGIRRRSLGSCAAMSLDVVARDAGDAIVDRRPVARRLDELRPGNAPDRMRFGMRLHTVVTVEAEVIDRRCRDWLRTTRRVERMARIALSRRPVRICDRCDPPGRASLVCRGTPRVGDLAIDAPSPRVHADARPIELLGDINAIRRREAARQQRVIALPPGGDGNAIGHRKAPRAAAGFAECQQDSPRLVERMHALRGGVDDEDDAVRSDGNILGTTETAGAITGFTDIPDPRPALIENLDAAVQRIHDTDVAFGRARHTERHAELTVRGTADADGSLDRAAGAVKHVDPMRRDVRHPHVCADAETIRRSKQPVAVCISSDLSSRCIEPKDSPTGEIHDQTVAVRRNVNCDGMHRTVAEAQLPQGCGRRIRVKHDADAAVADEQMVVGCSQRTRFRQSKGGFGFHAE